MQKVAYNHFRITEDIVNMQMHLLGFSFLPAMYVRIASGFFFTSHNRRRINMIIIHMQWVDFYITSNETVFLVHEK